MREKIKDQLVSRGISFSSVNVSNCRVDISDRAAQLFYFKYSQYPDCCGIVILHDFAWSYRTSKEAITEVVIKAFIDEMALDPDSEGPAIAHGPYGSIIIADVNDWFKDLLIEMGFKLISTFENPKTSNEIYTLIYTA